MVHILSKKYIKNIAKSLILALILSNQGMFSFAESINNIVEETEQILDGNEKQNFAEDQDAISSIVNEDIEKNKMESAELTEDIDDLIGSQYDSEEEQESNIELQEDLEEIESDNEPMENLEEEQESNIELQEDLEEIESDNEPIENLEEEINKEPLECLKEEQERDDKLQEDLEEIESDNEPKEDLELKVELEDDSDLQEEIEEEQIDDNKSKNVLSEEQKEDDELQEDIEEKVASDSELYEDTGDNLIKDSKQLKALLTNINDEYIASDSVIEEIAEEELSLSNMLFGATFATQSITLDFGFGPQFDESDWAAYPDAARKFELEPGSSNRYFIIGTTSVPIVNSFNDVSYPKLTYGSGDHIKLPVFDTADNVVWEGYKFVCWQDEEGNNLNIEQNGTFLYAFQGLGNVVYTAYWEKVEKNYNLNVDFISERTSTQSTVFNNSNVSKIHRSNVYVQPLNIPGFKIDKISPRVGGVEISPNPLDALKTLSYDGTTYLDMSSEDISVDAVTKEVRGAMPNHDLDIKVCYIPDTTVTNKFTINYKNIDGTVIAAQNVQYLNVETLLDYKPLSLDNYQYNHAVVDCGPTSIITGAYELGFFTLDGQIISPTDSSDTSDNQGRFYTLMPNQNLELTYYYNLISATAKVTVNKHIQKRNGDYDIHTQIINIVPSADGSIKKSFVLENKENKGYAPPLIDVDNPIGNPTLFNSIYDYTSGIGSPNGSYQFYVTSYANRVIDVIYNYDYNSPYWTKIEYYAYNTDAGHGYMQAASGSLALDNRYFKRDTYTISELLEDIDITPNENYLYKVYKNNATTPGPVGDPLEGSVELDASSLSLFINFEEDPNDWIDIYFAAVAESTLIGETHIHISKDTPVASISFPIATTSIGFIHNGEWKDASGNLLADPLTALVGEYVAITYYPVIVSVVGEYASPVKPLVNTTYNSNGKGTAKLYIRYLTRDYVLTDKNDKILLIKRGTELANGFTNLYAGKTYHLYELMTGTTRPAIGSVIVPGANVSEKCVFGISSVGDNYVYDETNSKITITPVQNISYALLDDKYNVVKNWTLTPNFTNLTNGTYYLIVAKYKNDNIAANDEDAIRNGVVVFTEKIDSSARRKRLILIGQNAAARNMLSTETTGSGISKRTVYSLQTNAPVTLIGGDNMKWEICSQNVSLTSVSSQMPTAFNMPSEDTIIRNYSEPSSSIRYKVNYHIDKTKMAFVNENSILTKLNEDANIALALTNNAIVKHHIVLTRRPTNKSVVTALTGKIAPYEYSVDIISEVNDKPYPNSKCSDPDLDLSAFIALDDAVVGNRNFETTEGSFTPLYTTSDDMDIGSAIVELNCINNVAIKYEKVHRIQINSSVDTSVNDIYYAVDNKKIPESISEYETNIKSRFKDYFDMSNVAQPSVSTYNAKEYIYKGVYVNNSVFDATNSIIKKKMQLVVKYQLNTERERYKELLSLEIGNAVNKEASLVTQSLKNIMSTAIIHARAIKDFQTTKTVNQIKTEYVKLHNLILNTNDPPQPASIILDANGGILNVDSIVVYKGNEFTFATLSNVTKKRDGYNFVSWNTKMDGGGTTVTPNTIVGNDPPTVLYAIWEEIFTPTPHNSGNSGGGGGGGGGGRTPVQIGDQVMVKPILENPIEFDKKVLAITAIFPGFANTPIYSDEKLQPFYIYDPNNNKMSLYFGNMETGETLKNQWIIFERHLGNETRYQTHLLNEEGVAVTGFQIVGNMVYYLNEEEGEHFSTLKTGWIYNKDKGEWYYASPITGALLGGWQNIDGKDYYFTNNRSVDAEGKEYISVNDMSNGFGVMLKNCVTPDGYILDENGARIIFKP